jgi:hypothetical protein
MDKLYIIVIIIFGTLPAAFSQKHDVLWLSGYDGGSASIGQDDWGINIIKFIDSPSDIKISDNQDYEVNFALTNTILCDSFGNLVLYSNGQHVYGNTFSVMPNGNFIGINNVANGYNVGQGTIALPLNGKKSAYCVINTETEFHDNDASGKNLFFNLIQTDNNNVGTVLEKRTLISDDYIAAGQITAVKHANGRDWWVTAPKWFSEKYYQLLIDTSGVKSIDTLITTDINKDGAGMAKYTPDGSKYVRAVSKQAGQPFRIDIFDFDRCTGQLSNQITKLHPQQGFGVGVEFSSNSRYLYIFRTTMVFQYDLYANDIFATETLVGEYDGFLSNGAPFTPTTFYASQTGFDDRIYIASTHTGKHLHYMNFPNRQGENCKLIQHGIELRCYNDSSIPNLPNFRLGPVDGSSCDTLGFDNHPLARFRWDFEDTLTPLRVTFTDMSAYEPDSWHWAFGDGVTYDTTASGEVFHVFPAPGLYTVCLIVDNMYSADTICYDVQVGQSVGSTEVQKAVFNASVWPNPCRDQFTLHINSAADWVRVDIALYDALGRHAVHQAWRGPVGQVHVKGLPYGVYSARVLVEGKYAGTLQVLKVK